MDFTQTDFGQIDIYNNYFKYIDPDTIKYTPLECITNKLSYVGTYKNRTVPIMLGSKPSSHHTNPLPIKGYFIINGLCYSMNNMLFKIKHSFNKYNAFFSNGKKVNIQDMFTYYLIHGKTRVKWYLPNNWEQIITYAKNENKQKLKNHLSMVYKLTKKSHFYELEEENLASLAKMFECWLDLIDEPEQNFRLITPGEILNDCLDYDINILECFNKSSWRVKYINNVSCVSELMKHYNYLNDIESIRRVTYPTNRKNMRLPDRQIKFNNKYKLCPAQSPDGELCGTVYYLCKNAKIAISDIENPKVLPKGDTFLYVNGQYLGKCSQQFINTYFKGCDKIWEDKLCFISSLKGRIIPSDEIMSYTASLIPEYLYNPPVRTTFACSMLKQAITENDIYSNLLSDIKVLIKSDTLFGNNLLVAIMPWKGFNIEDSVVISESCAEKYKYKKIYIYREKKEVKFISKVKINQRVYKNQLLYKKFTSTEVQKVEHVFSKSNGIVTKVKDEIIVEDIRHLEVGDKMTSKHGQKGVISLIEKDENMPYIPSLNKYAELIVNPHAFPSRMTMGQLKEMGETKYKVKGVEKKIYVGYCEYLALRHQVQDKLQFYNKPPLDPITKQPKSLRFGQMERDILIGLNANKTLKELWSIDKTSKEFRQSTLICKSYLNALGYDIKVDINSNSYSIIKFKKDSLLKCDKDKLFGDNDVTDLRKFGDNVILPICLRSNRLNVLYKRDKLPEKDIHKEIKRLLVSKDGVFHRLFEGHNINHCMRSVITPNPNLPLNVVEIPIGINLGVNHCILNRQPSLNISSMKLMKIKYKNEKTISFNPLLCKSFNADFDGDEMNLYGISNEECVKELEEVLIKEAHPTQDYILMEYLKLKSLTELTKRGLTPDKEGITLMIESESKGEPFNLTHIYNRIGDIKYNNKSYHITSCYNNGISKDEWYLLCMISRNSTASIALNTPISGHLQNITNQLLL